MNKQETELRKGYAYRLFMSGETQKAIASIVGVSENTISRWANKDKWEQQRDDANTSTQALANSLMAAAKRMSEKIVQLMTGDDIDIRALSQCSDNLVKIMASAERITKSVTRATIIDVIIALDRWLINRQSTDKDLTPERVKLITDYHQRYIEELPLN